MQLEDLIQLNDRKHVHIVSGTSSHFNYRYKISFILKTVSCYWTRKTRNGFTSINYKTDEQMLTLNKTDASQAKNQEIKEKKLRSKYIKEEPKLFTLLLIY